jgi:hypothetical protein
MKGVPERAGVRGRADLLHALGGSAVPLFRAGFPSAPRIWPAWLRCRRRQVVAGVRWVSSIPAGDHVGTTVGTIRERGARHGQEKRSGLVGGGPR